MKVIPTINTLNFVSLIIMISMRLKEKKNYEMKLTWMTLQGSMKAPQKCLYLNHGEYE
jgi:hypothetical protein